MRTCASQRRMSVALTLFFLFPLAIVCTGRNPPAFLFSTTLHRAARFGYICSAVGHFPVLFTSSKANDFSVDKEAQAKVTEQLDQFIGSGGGLMIFPEGQLNSTPRKLQQFRRGVSSHACTYPAADLPSLYVRKRRR